METRSRIKKPASKPVVWLWCKKRWKALTHDKCPNKYDSSGGKYDQCSMHTFYHAAIRTKDDLRMRSILEHVSSLNGGVIKEDRYFTNNPLTFGTVSAGDDVAQKLPPDRSYFSLLNKVLESNNKIIETINTLHGANTPPTSQPGPYRHIESTGETDNDTDISS